MALQGSKQMKVRGCQVWTVGRMGRNFPTVVLQPLLCMVCDSMTWKHPSSPVTKKFKVQRSAAKVMATVFWDAKGVILLDILPQGQCINAARYCSTLDRLKEAICRKRLGLLRRGVVLQHDNATPHSANLTQQWLQRYALSYAPFPVSFWTSLVQWLALFPWR
ncbi:histone-lysine N-methyltransferase SETMAR [Plakobranchus ocellatus]|uniref:Histone-lysine N-methyltransferase SETMAR n=1 Tax=Plakobranchus ocellatus TaxID=259542 RepID=A0AAV4BF58_9GAST|nr:histone-lysine N-methyltransferase SETMAR [Plakobranchus ocellatus]